MSLQEHRQAIDRLDKQIVALLNERTKQVLEIGAIKIKAGEEIYAPHRELAVLERVCKLIPQRISGNCAKHQRQVSVAIKRARQLALMPFASHHGM
jgi:chorismate mutase